eukprot:TRINITY_DN11859_c0_g1_i2.p2 TRINITY_DN11859_c0_g1~~TRINITY_DN11859_c0_g1_i2.p2  ORF type:complete len:116 (+),score=38.02 TRINITY_DN11859_c0_g1_i2:298-645(+)
MCHCAGGRLKAAEECLREAGSRGYTLDQRVYTAVLWAGAEAADADYVLWGVREAAQHPRGLSDGGMVAACVGFLVAGDRDRASRMLSDLRERGLLEPEAPDVVGMGELRAMLGLQ